MTKSRGTRLREQRDRQQQYRDRQKQLRRPGRDDIARIALRWLIIGTSKLAERENNPARLYHIEDALLAELATQGFDPKASDEVLADLIDKYVGGKWDFRRKPHLLEG